MSVVTYIDPQCFEGFIVTDFVRTYSVLSFLQLPFTPVSELKRDTSQLEGPTPNNTYGFKVSQSALPLSCDSHEVS